MDLSACVVRGGPRNGVGLSPVSVVGRCDQATPPPTPRARQKNRNALCRKRSAKTAPCFSTVWSLARTRGRNATPPDLFASGPSVTVRCRTTLAAASRGRWTRTSGQERPRPGRIEFSLAKGTTAPFKTKPTTPAAHTNRQASTSTGLKNASKTLVGKLFFGCSLGK